MELIKYQPHRNFRTRLRLSVEQGWRYAICRCRLKQHSKDQGFCGVLDHDHWTGYVRAVLCPRCNTGLGLFRDKLEFLETAIAYLKQHRIAHGPIIPKPPQPFSYETEVADAIA